MCGCRLNTEFRDNESKREVLRGKGSDWRLLKAVDASSHCVCPDILTGYRPTLGYVDCLRSILRVHNETVNIWSHLLGFSIFTLALIQHLNSDIPKVADWIDHTSRIFQIFSYQLCMIASVLFHTFLCHSPRATKFWLSCDRAGILFSLFATYLRVLAKTFPCHPLLRATHLIIVCILFTSVALQLFGEKKEGSAPILPFVGIALYAVAPILHSAIVSESEISIASIAWLFLPHLLAGLGVLVYLLRFPENLLPPGSVDLWGSSHQLWHALIFSGDSSSNGQIKISLLPGMLSWYWLDPKEAEGNICF